MAASTYQIIALAIYFVAMIAIGLWANSKNNSLDDRRPDHRRVVQLEVRGTATA